MQAWLWCGAEGPTSQLLLSLVSSWTRPLALPERLIKEIRGSVCSLRSAGAPRDGCIYLPRAGSLW